MTWHFPSSRLNSCSFDYLSYLAVKSVSRSSASESKPIFQTMSDPNSLKDIMAKAPQNSHLGSKTIVSSGELDIGEMIEKSGCNDFYSNLEECLGENNRDWRKCQLEVQLGSSRKMDFVLERFYT
jgi:hypothetical protein